MSHPTTHRRPNAAGHTDRGPGLGNGRGQQIFWDRPDDPEVVGHRVYRRSKDQSAAEMIGEVNMPSSIFVDKSAPEDSRPFYSVTAIDAAEPANESKPSPEATVR